MVSSSVEALANLAAQLSSGNQNEKKTAGSCTLTAVVRPNDDDETGDFSSFPSLSLEESPGNFHTGTFQSRGDVETHVESLLSRPILLGKQQDEDDRSSAGLLLPPESEEDDSLDEFFVENFDEVPKAMMNNFCTSFATLMNSRLRAYASFLARHALSLAKCSKTDQEMEGVIGIEQKLETMLGIGSQISTGSVSSEFTIDRADIIPSAGAGDEDEDQDEAQCQVSRPLKLNISVTIALPHVKEADGNESMKVHFETTGKICGIFSKDGAEPNLCVAEVSLNIHELLTAMAEQASKVISRIVEMTNAAYAVPLVPPSPQETTTTITATNPLRAHSVVVAPYEGSSNKRKAEDTYDQEEDDDDSSTIVSLSAEKCANIVDCVIGELDDDLLTPPHKGKKIKVVHFELA